MSDLISAVGLRILGSRDDIAGLRAINTSILKTGAAIYIASARTLFILDRDSTEVPDGTAVVAPVNSPGRWLRQQVGVSFLTQTEWAIDFENGDDSAAGTLAAPLKTGAEWTRRTYGAGLVQPVTVDILSSCPDPSADSFMVNSPIVTLDGYLTVRGATPEPLASGSFSVVTNHVANTSQTTVEATIDLSAHVGRRLRKTGGPSSAPVGTIAYIEAESAGVATLSSPAYEDTTVPGNWGVTIIQQLEAGDTFVIEEPLQMCSSYARTFGVKDFLSAPYGRGGGFVNLSMGASERFEDIELANFQLYGCRLHVGSIACLGAYVGSTAVTACRFTNLYSALSLEGIPSLSCNSFATYVTTQSPGSAPLWHVGNSIRGFIYQVQRSGRAEINNSGTESGLCIHEWPVTSGIGAALHVNEGCMVNLDGVLWGSSTQPNTFGIRVDACASCVYLNSRKPTISGTLGPTKDVEIGGTSLPYSDVPTLSANITNFAALVRKN